MRILLVSPNPPWPPHTGSAQRTALLLEALREHGDVRTLCLRSPSRMSDEERRQLSDRFGLVGVAAPAGAVGRGAWPILARLHRPTAARLAHFADGSRSRYLPDRALIERIDLDAALDGVSLVVGRYTASLAVLDLLDRGMPTLIDVDDLDSAALGSRRGAAGVTAWQRWNAARHHRRIARDEVGVFRRASALWVANPDDLLLPSLAGAILLPNVPFGEVDAGSGAAPVRFEPPIVGCIASYRHAPNVEGVDWFLAEVWPAVHRAVPTARFRIYGSQLGTHLAARWSAHEGVEVPGFVENVGDAYAGMTLAVCPVQHGAGTNIKVLEAGQHGRLCVLSACAARGFASDPRLAPSLVTTADTRGMSDSLIHHLVDRDANARATAEFSNAVREGYTRSAFFAAVRAGVDRALSDTPGRDATRPRSRRG